MARHSQTRRGVLLLVILGLLAMFALVAITFVIIAGQHRQTSKYLRSIEQFGDPPKDLLNGAALQLLRGTNNPQSVIGPHSLLEDLYGSESIAGVILSPLPIPPFAPGGALSQLFEFVPGIPGPNGSSVPYASPLVMDGCVLTMIDGVAAGRSTRIVGFNGVKNVLQALAFDGVVPQAGDRFVVNGRPFSGPGFGFDPNTGLLDARRDMTKPADPKDNPPFALLPNPTDPEYRQYMATYGVFANEDYDAPDFQNMILAAQIPVGQDVATIPSLHRPDLIRYFAVKYGSDSTTIDCTKIPLEVMRKIMLRPPVNDNKALGPLVNPQFRLANPSFDPVYGPWDIDNDGDGHPDSIWVDLGFPVQATKDGRRYRPLFAILCVDLDGRLNLNAHGSLMQTDPRYYTPIAGPFARNLGATGPAPTATLPRGQGYGPADTNLGPLFVNLNEYLTLLQARYAEAGVTSSLPGLTAFNAPSTLGRFQYAGFPFDYFGYLTNPNNPVVRLGSAFGTPPDLQGRMAIGLDLRGQPWYDTVTSATSELVQKNQTVHSPYEVNLSLQAPRASTWIGNQPSPPDNPFSAAELERLLRPNDIDTRTLSERLALVAPSLLLQPGASRLVTTDSWDLPCPSPAAPPELVPYLPKKHAASILDILIARMNQRRVESGRPAATPAEVMKALALDQSRYSLLPAEMLAGLRMDIDRPFGNGRDDNGNGVVDEPEEAGLEKAWHDIEFAGTGSDVPAAGAFRNVPFDHNNDGVQDMNDLFARQAYARHLYVLLMLLKDAGYIEPNFEPGVTGVERQRRTAQRLAQYAVNVVDFRDADAIMTPFEYDIDPFTDENGDGRTWDVDGVIGTQAKPSPDDTAPYRGLVWGCERPELLITETLETNDRRSEDLDNDNGGKGKFDLSKPAAEADHDFDQRLMPEGSLFIELHNPWSMRDVPPAELYDAATRSGVDLTKTSLDGTSPVWRMIITPGGPDSDKDPDDPVAARQARPERSVYFVDVTKSAKNVPNDSSARYYQKKAVMPIGPDRYALIGPAPRTYMGRRKGGEQDDRTRRIELTPNVAVLRNGGNEPRPNAIKPAIGIVIDQPRRLSVSEPVGGYPPVDPVKKEYDPPLDTPLDKATREVWTTGTTSLYRVVHLQRLANPLEPWEATLNPYRTIDTMAVDLTAFNGVEDDSADPTIVRGTVTFKSRQRGEANDRAGANNLWRQEPMRNLVAGMTVPDSTHRFAYKLDHSLGYLNSSSLDPARMIFGPFQTVNATPEYKGDPERPFPWLTWNNRPYSNPMELLLVPACSPSRLLREYGMRTPGDDNHYGEKTPNSNPPFSHLLNFCQSSKVGANPNDPKNVASNYYRALEYLRVPSPFVGGDAWLNPIAFAGQKAGMHAFHPPFNRISGYLDPGRVNLNTIYDPRVWDGLMNKVGPLNGTAWGNYTDLTWRKLVESRRGYADQDLANPSPIPILAPNAAYPTCFANPFRSLSANGNAPVDVLRLRPDGSPRNQVDATLLRADPQSPTEPLLSFRSLGAYENTERNPYFRYEVLNRLGNSVTTRSNVYAVWITVGYFEVEAVSVPDPLLFPDGFQLKNELGADTGEIERHRAFYIFDRSIPVGFQRGENLNVHRSMLLERYIE
ncbi:MAG: hypothetical protein ACYC0Y_14235 [Pirellulales bacterium]